MSTITVITQLCQEDRDRLDRIIAALERPAPKCESCVDSVADFVDDRLRQNGLEPAKELDQVPAEAPQVTEDTTPEEKPAEAQETAKAEPEQPSVTHADIQKKVVALSAAGKKAEVRGIVMDYASKVSGIPEDKLAEVWQKLTDLEG